MELGWIHSVRVADLPRQRVYRFCLSASAEERQKLCCDFDLLALKKALLRGGIAATGKADWIVTAHLYATVTQTCVITLKPVITHIQDSIKRVYSADWDAQITGTNSAIPEADTVDPLTDRIDIGAILCESLALALPLYPRVQGIDFGSQVFAAPGAHPVIDTDAHPFAGLKKLYGSGKHN